MNYLNISKKEYIIKIKKFLKYASESYFPNVHVNTVIFSYHEDRLNILLMRLLDTPYFMLTGGSIMKDEDLDHAAYRSLKERTGLENIYLEQFYTIGKASHNADEVVNILLERTGTDLLGNFINGQNVTVCYYALVDEDKLKPATQDFYVSEHLWIDVHHLPKLLLDQNFIVDKAIEKLQNDLDRKLGIIGRSLMNETFTMGELQKLYEAVFQQKFTRTNFQRKMLSLNIFERLEKQYNGKSHKAPYLYRFKKND